MLSPKRIRHRKVQKGKGRLRGVAQRGTTVDFGDLGIQALEACELTNRQIEAARITMTRKVKRAGRVWIRVFPDKPVTSKPAETRMGKGKGSPDGWVAEVRPGRILFEMGGVESELAKEALNNAAQKLPIKVKIVEALER